jgi:hypothetical protein
MKNSVGILRKNKIECVLYTAAQKIPDTYKTVIVVHEKS